MRAISLPNILLLLLQIVVVLSAAHLVGLLVQKIGQPRVIGEMIAGLLLGPSLLGWVAPDLSAALFPPASLGFLNALSQIGLILFMFLVGLELDPAMMQGLGRAAVTISLASIIVPFVLGMVLAQFLYPQVSDESVPALGFSLFVGAALSVTAFPVLARILTERGLAQTRLGAMAIACAAVNDAAAWGILAAVVLIVRAGDSVTPLWVTLVGSAVYLSVMLLVVRPRLHGLGVMRKQQAGVTQGLLTVLLLFTLASAWVTEWLGLHAIFGAFLAGAVLPKDRALVHDVAEKLHDLTVVLLLPLFFTFTGLRTSIGLLSGWEMWALCALVILTAILGKFGGATLAARATGQHWREATALGLLMNTRGLVELVILGVGLEIGVLSPTLFAMMVLMALVTTFMTTPLLEMVYPSRVVTATGK